jgi:Holliday junction resolvase-like predicted endonuclease
MKDLVHKGWVLQAANFRRPGTEIDLIMLRNNVLAVVEVKERRSYDSLAFYDLVNPKKRLALMRGADCFLQQSMLQPDSIVFVLAVFKQKEPTQTPAIEYLVIET